MRRRLYEGVDTSNLRNYDYLKAVEEDVMEYITNEIGIEEAKARIEDDEYGFAEELNDTLWVNDSVTGNASGSYWFSAYKAEEALCHNFQLYLEAEREFGGDIKQMVEDFSAEKADITIRCYLLSDAIANVIERIKDEY